MVNVEMVKDVTEEQIKKANHIFRVYDKNSVNVSEEKKHAILRCFSDLIEFEKKFQVEGFGSQTATKYVLNWEQYIAGDNAIMTKETHEGEIQAVLVMSPLAIPGCPAVHVSYTWVPEKFRKQLNGAMLLECAEHLARVKYGAEHIHLSCLPRNDVAYEFYRRNGYLTYMNNMSKGLK